MSSMMPKKKTNLRSFALANAEVELDEYDLMEAHRQAEVAIATLLDALRIDYKNDHNMRDTPKRVAKMYIEELFAGRFQVAPSITTFENAAKYDQLIVVGPIRVKSMCSHHLMPISGYAHVGILPSPKGKIIGLSKYVRIVDFFARRPQIQEELTKQILDFLVEKTDPAGVAVRIVAKHFCMCHRGVNDDNSEMTTTQLFGELTNPSLKAEFLAECQHKAGP